MFERFDGCPVVSDSSSEIFFFLEGGSSKVAWGAGAGFSDASSEAGVVREAPACGGCKVAGVATDLPPTEDKTDTDFRAEKHHFPEMAVYRDSAGLRLHTAMEGARSHPAGADGDPLLEPKVGP